MNLVCINCTDDSFGKSGFNRQAFSPREMGLAAFQCATNGLERAGLWSR